MAKAIDIINKAKSYIGTKESPAGSNNVIFNTHYYGKAVSGSAYPWCCVFVWDIFRMCGASELLYDGKKVSYCPYLQDWGKKKGLSVNKNNGNPGDIVFFDWNSNGAADHVGIIIEKNNDGTYTTIEGNTSLASNDNGGNVMRRTRKQSEICTILRPRYDKDEATPVVTNKKTLDELAKEVIAGKWGTGEERKKALTAVYKAGQIAYDYATIQKRVNELCKEADAKTIKVGSKVKVKSGAKSYEGKKVALFVYLKTYTVDEIKGDRAVLNKKGICTAFNIKDLIIQ